MSKLFGLVFLLGVFAAACSEVPSSSETTTTATSNFSNNNGEGVPSLKQDTQVMVPTDYATVGAAFKAMSLVDPSSFSISIYIEEGYKISEETQFRNGDYSHFTITCAADTVIEVHDSFPSDQHLFSGRNVRMPVLDCLFDMKGLGRDGYHIAELSAGVIRSGAGVVNAGEIGLHVTEASSALANGSLFAGAGEAGIAATQASRVAAQEADVSLSKGYGVNATEASMIDARAVNANYATNTGIRAAHASFVNASHAFANFVQASDPDDPNQGRGIRALGASGIQARHAEAKETGGDALRSSQMSFINFTNGKVGDGLIQICCGGGLIGLYNVNEGFVSKDPNELTSAGIIFDSP